ncbi:MAG: aspartyl/asparaginyl beta-hydroxylase domain-containing protein [Bacteroidetes bacterium]|nr:aspartyl/asparaginyl beta-hydroxylase domain-containing protein [Bacteroidota bacterium]
MKAIWEKDSGVEIKPWYSYHGGKYSGALPSFFDETGWAWLEEGRKNYAAIRQEIEILMMQKTNSLEPYFNKGLVNEGGKWEVVKFFFWGQRVSENCTACPQLNRFLSGIPGLLTAGLSHLAPHTRIHPHLGDTNTVARCHLGLKIPAQLPQCGLKVKEESRSWKEGEWIIFCDAYEHTAWNETDEARFILIIDVLLPRFLDKRNDVAANVLSLLKLQELEGRKKWVRKLPGKIRGMIRRYYKSKLK